MFIHRSGSIILKQIGCPYQQQQRQYYNIDLQWISDKERKVAHSKFTAKKFYP